MAEEIFFSAETCAFCHSKGAGALVDEAGRDVSIWHDWQGSMMANAFRDPVFRAKLETELERSPGLEAVIQDKCTRCHAPMGRTQHYHDGGKDYGLAEAEGGELAEDGVSCALCHQIQPDHLGEAGSFSGHYVVEGKREIYGPYEDVFTMPMRHHLDMTPMKGEQISDSGLCGSCHVLFTPVVDGEGRVHGEFPEQTVYLEWLNSDYAEGARERSCQECHLRRAEGAVKITRRPPWLETKREPFRQHTFDGGNSAVLALLREEAEKEHWHVREEQLEEAVGRAGEMLGRAVELKIGTTRSGGQLGIDLAVRNRTGHKLPTGYPARRVWVHLRVMAADGVVVFESGGWDEELGDVRGLDEPYEVHHDVIERGDQVQVYQSVMGDLDGVMTHTLLRAASYLKDNRIPPRGFRSDGPEVAHTRVAGKAVGDEDFNRGDDGEGTGMDVVHYRVAVGEARYPLRVEAELCYQSVSSSFLRDVLDGEGEAKGMLRKRLEGADLGPVRMAVVSCEVGGD
jgi:hypothetical protein